MKSAFHIKSINGFRSTGLSPHEMIGQHILSPLHESSLRTSSRSSSLCTKSMKSLSVSGIVHQDCSKKCPFFFMYLIPSAAVISSDLSPAIFPTQAVPVWIPLAQANLANFERTSTEKPIGFSGLVYAP